MSECPGTAAAFAKPSAAVVEPLRRGHGSTSACFPSAASRFGTER
jgi:hypothetical protein